jgi:hypothetical protein
VGAGPGADTAIPPNVAPGFGAEHEAGSGPSDYSEDAETGVAADRARKGSAAAYWRICRIRSRRPHAPAEAHPANADFNWRPLDVARRNQ